MNLINLKNVESKWIKKVLDLAIKIKRNPKKYENTLHKKTLLMLFQKTSTRTRISFETGMTQLGGHAIYLDWRTTNITVSKLSDEAKVISRYSDLVMARMLKTSDLLVLEKNISVPVINGLCQKYHPCQALGDLLTIKEKRGKLKGLNVTYFGLGDNVSNSLSLACVKSGINFTLCVPERNPVSVDKELLLKVKKNGLYEEEKDPKKAVKGADIIYTDAWAHMETFNDPKFKKERDRRVKILMPYQVNKKLIQGNKALLMHPMPLHRGYEMDDYASDSKRNIMIDQAENRLHVQKAIIVLLAGK